MKFLFAVLLGKLIQYLSKALNIGGGSAAPGLYALQIDPNLVEKLTRKIPKNIIITGTNGKTTTARMLAHFAKASGLKVIRNHTGSNLERGIASTLISHYTLYPRPYTLDLGIWELDEAAFNIAAPKINPDIVVFLNISRDQLDRYGEIDKVVDMWCETVSKLDPKTIVLINSDDPNLKKLEKHFKGKISKFGKKNIENVKLKGLSGSSFSLIINHESLIFNLPLPGLYHIYDAVAALVTAHYLNLPAHKSFQGFQPSFGRFEKLPFGYIFLIKNPAGATQVFETITDQFRRSDRLLLALNDNLADGTDVSWIWDANFEALRTMNYELRTICSGTRAYDLAVRLKYAGFDVNQIKVESDLKKALKWAQIGLKGRLFILPTYTAMLKLQRILTKSGIKKHYWEEES